MIDHHQMNKELLPPEHYSTNTFALFISTNRKFMFIFTLLHPINIYIYEIADEQAMMALCLPLTPLSLILCHKQSWSWWVAQYLCLWWRERVPCCVAITRYNIIHSLAEGRFNCVRACKKCWSCTFSTRYFSCLLGALHGYQTLRRHGACRVLSKCGQLVPVLRQVRAWGTSNSPVFLHGFLENTASQSYDGFISLSGA